MRRRQVIAAACGCAVATAGCMDRVAQIRGEIQGGGHALSNATATVRIDDLSDSDHDLERNAREALGFWEDESQEYVGFSVGFEVVEAEDPDMVIAYEDSPRACQSVEGYSEQVLGCAPLVRVDNRFPDPAVARVVAANRPFGQIRTTTQHEIGHILGLGHDDEPLGIMSDDPEDRIPLYDVRTDIWETAIDGQETASDGMATYRDGGDAWTAQEYEAAAETFGTATGIFGEALDLFETARARTDEFEGNVDIETVDLSGVRTLLDHRARRMELGEGFSGKMADASAAAAADNPEDADRLRQEANDMITEFNDLGAIELREVAVALGLVRGFDRTDTVGEVGD